MERTSVLVVLVVLAAGVGMAHKVQAQEHQVKAIMAVQLVVQAHQITPPLVVVVLAQLEEMPQEAQAVMAAQDYLLLYLVLLFSTLGAGVAQALEEQLEERAAAVLAAQS
jgi:hypothetical protein